MEPINGCRKTQFSSNEFGRDICEEYFRTSNNSCSMFIVRTKESGYGYNAYEAPVIMFLAILCLCCLLGSPASSRCATSGSHWSHQRNLQISLLRQDIR